MIGRLDQKITIQRATRVKDAGGVEKRTWAALANDAKPWARVKFVGEGEDSPESGSRATIRAVFTIRARDDLRETDRILWDGRAWNITGLGRAGSRVRYMDLSATAGEISP